MKNLQASMAIQIAPRVYETKRAIEIIDRVIENIQASGLKYQVGAFETSIEGDLDVLLEIIKQSFEICIKEGCPSAMSYIKLVYSPNEGVLSIEEKTAKYS